MSTPRPSQSPRARIAVLTAVVALVVAAAVMPGTASAATCSDFSTQQDAQSFYNQNPSGNANLDTNRNGIACENLAGVRSPIFAATGFPAWLFVAGAAVVAGGALMLRRRPRLQQ
jgi:excalibur calcium-binding domain-containing protein